MGIEEKYHAKMDPRNLLKHLLRNYRSKVLLNPKNNTTYINKEVHMNTEETLGLEANYHTNTEPCDNLSTSCAIYDYKAK